MKLIAEEEDQELQSTIDKLREESLIAQNEMQNKEKNLKMCQSQKYKIIQELNEVSVF